MKNILCVTCRSTFSDEELDALGNVTSCPACGSTGVPADLTDSVTVTLTRHELRILTIWASNYAHSIKDSSLSTQDPVACINGLLSGIRNQTEGPLTIAEELQDVADTLGLTVSSSMGDFEPPTTH